MLPILKLTFLSPSIFCTVYHHLEVELIFGHPLVVNRRCLRFSHCRRRPRRGSSRRHRRNRHLRRRANPAGSPGGAARGARPVYVLAQKAQLRQLLLLPVVKGLSFRPCRAGGPAIGLSGCLAGRQAPPTAPPPLPPPPRDSRRRLQRFCIQFTQALCSGRSVRFASTIKVSIIILLVLLRARLQRSQEGEEDLLVEEPSGDN